MGDAKQRKADCKTLALKFLENKNTLKWLDLIINIYDEIIYSETDRKTAQQKFLRVLYNLKQSSELYSLLGKEDKKTLNSFLEDFLKIKHKEDIYYIENESFAILTLDEIYHILIEIRYLKKNQ